MGEFQSWVIEWFYVAVLLLSGIGAIFFGFKLLFRLILFSAYLWLVWWSATHLGLIDETALKRFEKITFSEQVPPKAM